MVRGLVVEVPTASTKTLHTEVAKITKKFRIWIQPLSVSSLLKNLRDLCDLRVKNSFFIGPRMVRGLVVEVPTASTKTFHTEVAKITKKFRIWIQPLSLPDFCKIILIFAISV
jgi:predicted component of type VI protein secretion system